MPSVKTNYGKAFGESVAFRNAPPGSDLAADIPTAFAIILLQGYDFVTANPDHDTIAELGAGVAVDPAGATPYSGHMIDRGTDFIVSTDDVADRGMIAFAAPPTITVGATALSNITGFALCTRGDLTAANRIIALVEFANGPVSIGASQTLTVSDFAAGEGA